MWKAFVYLGDLCLSEKSFHLFLQLLCNAKINHFIFFGAVFTEATHFVDFIQNKLHYIVHNRSMWGQNVIKLHYIVHLGVIRICIHIFIHIISKSKMKKSLNVGSKCHQVLSKVVVYVMYKTLLIHLRYGKK